jgi:hypothetical protein
MPPHSTTLLEHAQQAQVHVADLAEHGGALLYLHGLSTEHGYMSIHGSNAAVNNALSHPATLAGHGFLPQPPMTRPPWT